MSDAEITSNKIREQVEFYFSDSNLPKDKFLRSLVANNPEGCKCFILSILINRYPVH